MNYNDVDLPYLADHECEHGCLPEDGDSPCGCFPLPGAEPLVFERVPDPAKVAQAKLALTRANVVRKAIADERQRIAAMPYPEAAERVAEILDRPGDVLGGMHVGHLLTAVHKIGDQKMGVLLAEVEIVSADRQLRQIPPGQRGRLAFLVLGWADRRAKQAKT